MLSPAIAAATKAGWRERYRERCRDENGIVHDVIVSKDDCEFELVETGMILSRCD